MLRKCVLLRLSRCGLMRARSQLGFTALSLSQPALLLHRRGPLSSVR
jgi:hypothetical protein